MSDIKNNKCVEKVCERLLCLNPTGVALKPNEEWVPAWSSYGLEQLIAAVLSNPESNISNLFLGFWKALSETNAPLTETMSNFIKDVVIYSWLPYREQFKTENFEWMVPLVNKGCTESQAYLALCLLNYLPTELTTKCKESILKFIERTEFTVLALNSFSE